MHNMRKLLLCLVGLLCGTSASGCKFFHEFQPHRLQRWNRGSGMESGYEAYWSVTDAVPHNIGDVGERESSDR